MSAATDQILELDGSTLDEETGEITCFTHKIGDVLVSLGCENFVSVLTGESVDLDIGGESHRLTRISDNQHTIRDLTEYPDE